MKPLKLYIRCVRNMYKYNRLKIHIVVKNCEGWSSLQLASIPQPGAATDDLYQNNSKYNVIDPTSMQASSITLPTTIPTPLLPNTTIFCEITLWPHTSVTAHFYDTIHLWRHTCDITLLSISRHHTSSSHTTYTKLKWHHIVSPHTSVTSHFNVTQPHFTVSPPVCDTTLHSDPTHQWPHTSMTPHFTVTPHFYDTILHYNTTLLWHHTSVTPHFTVSPPFSWSPPFCDT